MDWINALRRKLGIKIQQVSPEGMKFEREPIGASCYTVNIR